MINKTKNKNPFSRNADYNNIEFLKDEIEKLKKQLQDAEIRLQESDNRYLTLFESSPDPIVIYSKGKIVELNKAALKFTNVDSPGDLLGRSVMDFVHPDFKDLTTSRMKEVLESNQPIGIVEEKFVPDQGIVKDVEIAALPFKYNGEKAVQVVFRDITERKETERDLRISEERFRTLVETTSDFIWEVDKNGIYTYVSPQILSILGYSASEIIGKTPFDLMPKDEARRLKKIFKQHAKTKSYLNNIQNVNLHKNGNEVILETHGAPIFSDDGRLAGFRGIDRDITKRNEAEKALLHSENNYKQLVNNSLSGIYITQNHIMNYCNQKMAEIFGYKDPEELIGVHIRTMVAPESWDLVDREVSLRVSGKKETSRYEFVGLRKDGSHFNVEVLGSRIMLDGCSAMQGTLIDISERKKTEEKLIKSEQRYHQLFDFLPYGGEVLDTEGYIIDCSPSSTRILGYSREELIGKHITELFHEESIPIYHEKFSRIKRGDLVNSELKLIRKDGKVLDILRAGQPIFDKKKDKVTGILALNVDITEWKNAVRETKQLATVVEQASEVIVITDTEGTINYVNPAFERSTGYSAKEAIGKNPRLLKSGEQDNVFYQNLWDTIREGNKWQGVFTNRRKNGEIYYEEAVIFPIRDENEKIVNYAAIKRDITLERELEQQLKQMQKMEALGTLSGGVAHDFNNLLTIINGHAEIALLHTSKEARAYTDLTAIMTAGERAENLISQLLAFSRKQMHEPKVIDINLLITDFKKMLRRLIPEDISIKDLLNRDLPYIKADHSQIEQILINLVVNARDAIKEKNDPRQDKHITIQTSYIDLDKSFSESHPGSHSGPQILISVSDTGIGMDESVKSRIFEPFFTTKEIDKGTGLGLATVYGIVKQNGGFIDVETEKGVGTTCKIYWPTTNEKPSPELAQILKHKALSGAETILLVEDDEGVRDFTATTLKNFGYTIIEAINGRKAIEILKRNKQGVDLLITDIIMPEMNGQELAKRLENIIPLNRVLFVSGYTFDHLKQDGALEEGINFLQKPYSIHDILSKIRDILNSKI